MICHGIAFDFYTIQYKLNQTRIAMQLRYNI